MSSLSGDLRTAAFKVRGLGYLFQQHRHDEAPPLDEDQRWFGIGTIVDDIGLELFHFADRLERLERKYDDVDK